MNNIKKPNLGAAASLCSNSTKPTKSPSKIEVSLLLFVSRGERGVIQPEAAKEYGESCLDTTVSTLFHNHGINFKRKREKFINRAGTVSPFTRYSFLTEDDELRAKKLINHYRARRGLPPLTWGMAA